MFILFLEILPAGKGQMRSKSFLPLYEQPPEPMLSKDAQFPGQPSLIRLATTSRKGPLLPGLPPHCPCFLTEPPRPIASPDAQNMLHLDHSTPGKSPREAKESYSLDEQHKTEMGLVGPEKKKK